MLLVPRAGVEPARPFGQRILSPQRLPFRHPGTLSVTRILASLFRFPLIINTVTLTRAAWKMQDWSMQVFCSNSTTWPIASINFTRPLSIEPRVTERQISYSFYM
jgi:hypothetical protein